MSLRGLGAFAQGFAGARQQRRAREERAADAERQERLISALGALPDTLPAKGAMGAVADGTSRQTVAGQALAAPAGDGSLLGLIDRTEGGGNYSTLFGHSQRPGGRFAGVDVSRMTLDQLAQFTSPNGEYGQWVKGKVGRVATPMGRHQIVGSTLRRAARQMGLPGDTVFSSAVQDRVAEHLARQRLVSARSPAAKRIAMRAEWEGFKNVPDAQLDQAIARFEAGGGQLTPRARGAIGGNRT